MHEEDELTSKICGKQIFKLLTCKSSKEFDKRGNELCYFPRLAEDADEDGKHLQTSGSSTKLSSRSSSTLDQDEYQRSFGAPTTGERSASNRGGCSNTDDLYYQWNMGDGNGDLHHAIDSKGDYPVFFDPSDTPVQGEKDGLPTTQASDNTQGHKEGRDLMDNWTYSSDDDDDLNEDFAPVVIELLRQECNNYRGEAMALRAEIDSIRKELGSLRQQMSGLAFHSDSVWV